MKAERWGLGHPLNKYILDELGGQYSFFEGLKIGNKSSLFVYLEGVHDFNELRDGAYPLHANVEIFKEGLLIKCSSHHGMFAIAYSSFKGLKQIKIVELEKIETFDGIPEGKRMAALLFEFNSGDVIKCEINPSMVKKIFKFFKKDLFKGKVNYSVNPKVKLEENTSLLSVWEELMA